MDDAIDRFEKIDAAFRVGDLEALKSAVEDSSAVPNGPMPMVIGDCLEYAIYHSPIAFIRTLLEIGADVRPAHHSGFPPLIAAISCSRPQGGEPGRPDVLEILRLLLQFGADPNQRGINDYTALHMAVAEGNADAVKLLLEAGADPDLPTTIDECETPRDMARKAGKPGFPAFFARITSLSPIALTDKHLVESIEEGELAFLDG